MSVITHEPTTVDVPTINDEEAYRREVLLKAAELIETKGWTFGVSGMRPCGPYCILGATAHAMGLPIRPTALIGMGYDQEAPGRLIGLDWEIISQWNDRLRAEKKGVRRKVVPPGVVVAQALRKLANGASWEDATR